MGFQGVRRLILSHKDLQEIMLSSVTRRRACLVLMMLDGDDDGNDGD